MKYIKILFALIIIIVLVLCIIKVKDKFFNVSDVKNITEDLWWVIKNLNWIDSWTIQANLSWKIEEAKWLAEQYYNDVLKDYVNKAKNEVSWAVESVKWYYNQWVDDLWETITNKINAKVVEWLDKIKVK